MWCFAVNIFELSDEMKFRKVCFVSDIAEVNFICIVGINKEFCLNQSSVKIYFRNCSFIIFVVFLVPWIVES